MLLRNSGHAAPLASAAGRRRLDLPAPRNRATAPGPGTAATDHPPGQGEPALGLPAHPRRTATPRRSGLGDRDPHDAAPSRAGPHTAANGHHLAGVPAPAGRRDRRLRLLHGRHDLAAAAPRLVLYGTGHPPGPPGRGYRQPQRRLGHPAGRNLLRLEDQGRRVRFLVRDRDAKFCRGFDDVFGSEGAQVLVTP